MRVRVCVCVCVCVLGVGGSYLSINKSIQWGAKLPVFVGLIRFDVYPLFLGQGGTRDTARAFTGTRTAGGT